jgi:tricorn protease-like protein
MMSGGKPWNGTRGCMDKFKDNPDRAGARLEFGTVEDLIMKHLSDLSTQVTCSDKDGTTRQIANGRWLAIARTHLQEGFMALNRAVSRDD